LGYVGRFAPSPTGPLHLGSLLTAVASYVHARQRGGEWLVRIEDIDPPREVPGATDAILRALEAFELHWDRSVWYQSARSEAYRAAAQSLLASGTAFYCRCSRSRIRAENDDAADRYPGTCRDLGLPPNDAALRVRVEPGLVTVDDTLQGVSETDVNATVGDYVIVRRDGLPAYHLAVVVDDDAQRVTDVVRGIDLLDSTAVHMHLQTTLGLPTPRYAHVPVVVNAIGQKLSKQTRATPVDDRDVETPTRVLRLLGANAPADLRVERPRVAWQWAIANLDFARLRGVRAVTEHGPR
jgi:glutamyl-Q tRNA(Asp) synthetase